MIIVIVGPTGVGKTKLSIELAKKYNAEIINADSMQVYKDLNIGTAKITEEEKEGIPHHLLDIVEPTDIYTVYNYQKDCRDIIEKLKKQNKNIIIVGGTGLYIKAVLYDYRFDKEVNNNNYNDIELDELVKMLKSRSEIEIDYSNKRRVIRALEKLDNNSEFNNTGNNPLYDFYLIGLKTDRETLYNKINNRVDEMINNGLLDEVKDLYDKNIQGKAIDTGIGYKELYSYFNGEIDLKSAIELIKKNSRHYAKRQFTFFNNKMKVKWFDTNYHDFKETIDEIIKYLDDKNKN